MDERDDPTAFEDDELVTITKGELRAILALTDDYIYDSGSRQRQEIKQRLEKLI